MGVQDAVAAVRALAGEGQAAGFAVELRAPIDELLDGGGAFLDERVHGGAVAQAVAGVEGVLLVKLHLVVVAESHGDAALGVFGGRFVQALLGHHQDAAGGRQFDGGAQPGHARADDQKIGRGGHQERARAGAPLPDGRATSRGSARSRARKQALPPEFSHATR